MLQLRVFATAQTLADLAGWLEASGHGRHVMFIPSGIPAAPASVPTSAHKGQLVADIAAPSAHEVLAHVSGLGVETPDIALLRIDEIGPTIPGQGSKSLIWADMLGLARRNARPFARFLVFMTVAGVIAAYGVITVNSTLIVGAMAVSPDTLPLAAACVGLVGRQWRLAYRAFVTLAVGLGVTGLAAAIIAGLLDLTRNLPPGFSADTAGLSGLVTLEVGTVGVALAAGVAAMLALETRANAVVGVAISVTTIPAAAYLGVALAVDQYSKAGGALAVLGVNVSMLLIAGSATLITQRWLGRRSAPPGGTAAPAKRGGGGGA